ncbi:RNA polymerase sigma factor [Anaeromicropila populeti]|uniref:RNA polymerase sigma-70 factor, ECF subfamily n=1 Tax=Anaeromicropila populeti TaxID=37658 RepID=A0A1I6I9S1_9FIRM|nr:RNA polymerase sigma factor [Anaeromicropila populeti]SFR63374.1 RNA polymerase sigma-70 factor, ECF subfamily [Anaeromicropila populeti]
MLLFLTLIDLPEDKDKFNEIYQRYKHMMWYVANEIVVDPHLAEDAVQDAFLSLSMHMNKVGEVTSSQTKKFIFTIVKHKAIDLLRKRTRQNEFLGDTYEDLSTKQDLLSDFIHKDNYKALLICVKKLDAIYRIVFEYKYVHQLTDKEIAKLLNVTEKVVNVRIFRARKKLQKLLEEEVGFHEK